MAKTAIQGVPDQAIRWIVPGALVPVWIVLSLVPQVVGQTAVVALALGLGAALLMVAVWRGRADRDTLTIALVTLAPLLIMLFTSLTRAADRVTSLVGGAATPYGWLTWFTAWLWLVASMSLARQGSPARLSRILAWLAGAAAVAALLDIVGLIPNVFRHSELPSGFFDNPNTLAQGLALGIGGAVAWALSARSVRSRVTAWSIAALCAVGLAATDSRGVFVGVVVATALAWYLGASNGVATRGSSRSSGVVLQESDAPRRVALWAGGITAAVALSSLGLTMALASGRLGVQITTEANRVLSERVTAWHAALVQFSTTPLLGEGVQMFSGWNSWHPDTTKFFGIVTDGTFDAHSLPLSILLAAGVVGLLTAVVSSAFLAGALARVAAQSRWSRPLLALLGGLAAWSISLLVEWPNPTAMITAAAIAGTVLASGRHAEERLSGRHSGRNDTPSSPTHWPSRSLYLAAAVAAIALFVFYAPRATTAVRWAVAATHGGITLSLLDESYASTGDHLYVLQELEPMLVQASRSQEDAVVDERLSTLSTELRGAARWDADAAIWRIGTVIHLTRNAPAAQQWDAIASALDEGRMAEPSSSIWDWLGAREAARLGMKAEAARLTAHAEQLGLPDGAPRFP